MSDLERLARAICVDDNRDPDAIHPPGLGVPQWQHHVRAARAVVAALREPSKAMLAAGIEAAEECEDWTTDTDATHRVDTPSDAVLPTWQAMIDAILPKAEDARQQSLV